MIRSPRNTRSSRSRAGGSKDGGSKDSGPKDSGSTDGSPQDGGPKDGSPKDTGPKDSGPKDTDPKDTSPKDTSPNDSGSKDSGPNDQDPPRTPVADRMAIDRVIIPDVPPRPELVTPPDAPSRTIRDLLNRDKLSLVDQVVRLQDQLEEYRRKEAEFHDYAYRTERRHQKLHDENLRLARLVSELQQSRQDQQYKPFVH